jgi:hypothetical protein
MNRASASADEQKRYVQIRNRIQNKGPCFTEEYFENNHGKSGLSPTGINPNKSMRPRSEYRVK